VTDWVIAESPEDATKVWEESCGDDYSEDDHGAWVVEPDDAVITMADDWDDTKTTKTTKTCAEWAAEGRGFLCSTEY